MKPGPSLFGDPADPSREAFKPYVPADLSAMEEARHLAECEHIMGLTLEQRRIYIYGNGADLKGVLGKRGEAAVARIRETMIELSKAKRGQS